MSLYKLPISASFSKTVLVFSGLRPFVEPPSLEDSPESSTEQEQASTGVNNRRVSGAAAPPPVQDECSLDDDGIYFIFQFPIEHLPLEIWMKCFYVRIVSKIITLIDFIMNL